MSRQTLDAVFRAADANFSPVPGGLCYHYVAGTTTPIETYSDVAMTAPHSWPVVALVDGTWPQIYLADGIYKIVIKTAADVTLYTVDNVRQFQVNAPTYGIQAGTLVDDFGAKGDSATDDTAAFNAAIAALPSFGGDLWLRSGDANYLVTLGSLVVGSKEIVWRCHSGAMVNFAHVWNLPGRQDSFIRLGRPLVNVTNAAPGDQHYLDMRRQANFTGGTTAQQGKVARFENNVGANVGSSGSTNRCNEKAIIAVINSASNYANSVALTASAQTTAQGAVWSGEFTTVSGVVPASYAHRSVEMNISATGDDVNKLRRVLNVISHAHVFNVYDPTDSIHDGILIEAGTADMYYALRITDTTAKVRTAGVLVETAATTTARFDGIGHSGVLRIGSDENAISDQPSQIVMGGEDSSGAPVVYASIRSNITDNTAGSVDGGLLFYAVSGGAQVRQMAVTDDATNPIQIIVGGTLKTIQVGAADSGGAGYRMLRVTN